MPELRQNPATKEWVIFAPQRKARPQDVISNPNIKNQPSHKADCPFCPGNEQHTPNEFLSYHSEQNDSWEIRVVPNKYPALIPEGNYTRKRLSDFYRKMENALGSHEIVIESPLHNQVLGLVSNAHMRKILLAYKERYLALCKADYKLVTIFRNYGEAAGTSLEHPHSQIIATPIVPNSIRYPLEEATRYYDDHGGCVYCDIINQELQSNEQIVLQGKKFIVFEPFAARLPYETWITPVTHSASFGSVNTEELDELARFLNRILKILHDKLNNPAYNYVIQSTPCNSERNLFYHWSLVILPRLEKFAGFELGSGMKINYMLPEECAAILRETE
ncbi:MAG: galactose-1-phosphate uridylyltransferase [Candidatus Helarchaeota archaeon]|nr:galactose-1-phosphate uridylyltransferase [Candidatus Helarchaeota archaeon]